MLLIVGASGCAQAVRVQKFLGADSYVLPDAPTGQVAQVRYAEGYRDDALLDYRPDVEQVDGRRFTRPAVLTSRGRIELRPVDGPFELRVQVRNRGLMRRDFQPVVAVSGGLERSIHNEVRPLPRVLDDAWALPMHQLHNVYNDFVFEDGDLLLLEATDASGSIERYLFRTRQLGWRAKAGAQVLVQLPVAADQPAVALSPVLALSAAVGYRLPTRQPTLRWLGDKLAVVASLGVGSTAIAETDAPVDQQLRTVLNAALAGGGLELYDIVSVQVLGNVSAAFRDAAEQPVTLAVGFDAVEFARATRDAFTRLLWNNRLDRPARHGARR